MNIAQFAEQYRVKTRRDSCGDEIIPGRKFCQDLPNRVEYRSHVYEHGDGRFGLCLLLPSPAKWTYAKKRLALLNFTLKQDGDTEGTLLFDPGDPTQARAAIREARIKYRKVLSEAAKRELTDRIKRIRPAEDEQLLA